MKFAYLHIRVTEATKKKLKEAAKVASQEQGRIVTVSALVTEAALSRAQKLIRKVRVDPGDLPSEQHPD